MRRTASLAAVAAALALAGCSGDDPVDPDDITRNQVATLDVQLRQLAMRTSQYADSMEDASKTTCIPTHRSYNVDARTLVFNMQLVDNELDAAIVAHGGDGYADIVCTIEALMVELDYHGAVACQDATIELDRAEATRHLEMVGSIREHLKTRSAEIAAGLDAGSDVWSFALESRCP